MFAQTRQNEDWTEAQFLFKHGEELCDIADALKNPAFAPVRVDVLNEIIASIANDLFDDPDAFGWAVDKISYEMGRARS